MSKLLDSIIAVATKVAPMIVPGAAGAIEAVNSIRDLFDHAKGVIGEDNVAALEQGREAFEAHVAATVASAADALRG